MDLATPIFSSKLDAEIYIGPGICVNERLARLMCNLQFAQPSLRLRTPSIRESGKLRQQLDTRIRKGKKYYHSHVASVTIHMAPLT